MQFITNESSITITSYGGPGGSIVIPATINGLPVTAIADSAFAGQSNITSISIPDGVTSIGSSSFNGCTGLTGITLPDSVISTGLNVFSGCPNLTNVNTSDGLKIFLSQYASQLGLSAVAVNNFSSTTESQINAMVANSLAGNAAFLSSLGTNNSFLGALSSQILTTTNNYGLATKADLAALIQQTSPTNASYVQAVATNAAFISALVSQASFLSTTATNATFLSSLTTNPAFVTAVTSQILSGSNNYSIAVKQNQSLNFPAIAPITYSSNATVKLSATSSLAPITYSTGNAAIATVSNNVLLIKGAGSTTVTASQVGSSLYNPISATQTLTVNPITQTISFPAIAAQTLSKTNVVTLAAKSSANFPITYIVSNTAIATNRTSNSLTLLGTGTTTITATNAGTQNYTPAGAVQTLIVK